MQHHSIESGGQNGAPEFTTLTAQPFHLRYTWLGKPAIALVLITLVCILGLGGLSLVIVGSEAIAHPRDSKAVFNVWLSLVCCVSFVLLPVSSVVFRRRRAGWVLASACIYMLMIFSITDWMIELVHYYPRPNGFIWSFVPALLMQTPYLKRFYAASPGVREQAGAVVLGGFWGIMMALAMEWSLLF